MSRKDLFNAVQRKYLKTENSLSPMGESEQNAPKFNRIQKKYIEELASPIGSAEDPSSLAQDDIAHVILRSGSDEGSLKTGGSFGLWPQDDRGKALGMTGESLPEPDTLVFRGLK